MSLPMKRKRETEDSDLEDAQRFCARLLEKGGQDLAGNIIIDMVQQAGLTLSQLQKQKGPLSSFSSGRWRDVASRFGLEPSRDFTQLELFSFPNTTLPPSFHKRVMEASNQWLDVYQETGPQEREAARVRLMDAWYVPVCALFKGRLVDFPESRMPETLETSGGQVQHEVYMIEGIMLIVGELKMKGTTRDHVAQLMLELDSAYKTNKDRGFSPQPPVYAVLTDLHDFYFFSFDGSKFHRTKTITVSVDSRGEFLGGMMKVTEQLFSLLLHAYIQVLVAIEAKSRHRGEIGDTSTHNSTQAGNPTASSSKTPRPSLESWAQALSKARLAQTILVECNLSTVDAWEADGVRGLSVLDDSVKYLIKIGSNTDWDKEEAQEEIDRIIQSQCRASQ